MTNEANENSEKMRSSLRGFKPTLAMVLIQILCALVNVLYKLAANDGMKLPILVAYRFAFGAFFIVPVAILTERQIRPKLTAKVVAYSFVCGALGGSMAQNLFLKSLDLTSPTFAVAIINLSPAVTFILAVCLRLEGVGWNKRSGQAKIFGTLLGVGGAMLFTFYHGPALKSGHFGLNLLKATATHHSGTPQTNDHQHDVQNSALGLVLALASCLCYSIWYIVQSKMHDQYPCPYSFNAFTNIWSAIQATAYALCMERDWSQWILKWNIRLFCVVFSGFVGTGVVFSLTMWCIRVKGPLYVSVFNPLLLVMVAIAGLLLLEEKLHLGMLFGGILIVCGLYSVLWGKNKENKVSKTDEEKQTDEEK